MRTAKIIAAAVAAGVVGAGAVVTPVVLAANDDPEPARNGARWAEGDDFAGPGGMQGRGPGEGMGQMQGRGLGEGMGQMQGRGHGMGPGAGQGMRGDGDCTQLLDGVEKGSLSGEQEEAVATQAELEKLSHDVYLAFGEQTGDHRFERIAWSETHHLDAVRTLLDRYAIADPTEGLDEGEFESGAVQEMYDQMVDDGSKSLDAALDVSADHERQDITDLRRVAGDVDAPDVETVFEHLAEGSEMHLRAFTG